MAMENWMRIAPLNAVADGEMQAIQLAGCELLLVREQGEFYVHQGLCPHQGTLLAGGALEQGIVRCPGHGWEFDCKSGNKVGAGAALKTFPVEIRGEELGISGVDLCEWQQAQAKAARPAAVATRTLADLPGPKGLPLLGNLLQLDLPRLHLVLEQWGREYGSQYVIHLGRRPLLVLSDPALISQVLRQRPDVYRRLATVEPVAAELGLNGVFSVEGDTWRHQRRIVSQVLNTASLRRFFPHLRDIVGRLQARWARAAAQGEPVDVLQDLMCFTVDVTTRLTFGYAINTLEGEYSTLRASLEKVFPMINARVNSPFPYWRYVKLPKDRALDKALAEVRRIVIGLVAQCRARLEATPALRNNPSNFIEALLTATDDSGEHFTEEEVMANALTILMAGEDTTANTLAWMMHYLAQHPALQARLHAESLAVLGEDAALSRFEQIDESDWIETFIHETMRLKPVAPLLFNEPITDTILGDLHLPKGTAVFMTTRSPVVDEARCPNAQVFDPDRWSAAGVAAKQAPNKNDFVPFGAGPRFCPGRSLAFAEMKSVMLMLGRHFVISAPEGAAPPDEIFAFSMTPGALKMQFAVRPAPVNSAEIPQAAVDA